MKIINAGYQLIEEPSITRKIERVARVCYKSEDKIDEGTDMIMCRSLINRQHTAMLEHGHLILEVGEQEYNLIETIRSFMENMVEEGEDNKKCFLRYTNCADESKNYSIDNLHYVVSGNIRAWYEFMQYASLVNGLPIELYNLVNDNVNNIFNIDIIEFDSVVFNGTFKVITHLICTNFDFKFICGIAYIPLNNKTLSSIETLSHTSFVSQYK